MQIDPFGVEQWMNAHEGTARWNMAETCVDSLTLDELLALTGEADETLRRIRGLRLDYGAVPGSAELRAAIATLYDGAAGPDRVLVANGAIGANFLVAAALVEPGDTVICVRPTYQQLYSMPAALGARVVPLPLRPENGYLPDPDELRSLVDGGARLIVLNNPNNPTGALMDGALLREIAAVADRCGAWLHCDEVYRGLEHDPADRAPSVVALTERGISTGSASKAYSLAGLRTGWIVAPPEVVARCLQWRDYTTISCGAIDDVLAALALRHADALLARSREIVRSNLATVERWLAGEPRLGHVHPRAGTTTLVRYDDPLPSTDFCAGLFARTGTFVVPGACFDVERAFRVGYACSADVLAGGLAGISAFLRALEA